MEDVLDQDSAKIKEQTSFDWMLLTRAIPGLVFCRRARMGDAVSSHWNNCITPLDAELLVVDADIKDPVTYDCKESHSLSQSYIVGTPYIYIHHHRVWA